MQDRDRSTGVGLGHAGCAGQRGPEHVNGVGGSAREWRGRGVWGGEAPAARHAEPRDAARGQFSMEKS